MPFESHTEARSSQPAGSAKSKGLTEMHLPWAMAVSDVLPTHISVPSCKGDLPLARFLPCFSPGSPFPKHRIVGAILGLNQYIFCILLFGGKARIKISSFDVNFQFLIYHYPVYVNVAKG